MNHIKPIKPSLATVGKGSKNVSYTKRGLMWDVGQLRSTNKCIAVVVKHDLKQLAESSNLAYLIGGLNQNQHWTFIPSMFSEKCKWYRNMSIF